jgi:hypothetical protein
MTDSSRRSCGAAALPSLRVPTASLATALLAAACLASSAEGNDVLLVPESLGDRIWALSPVDGSVLSTSFIAPDGILSQPIHAIPSGTGTILIADEVRKSIFEYSGSGQYLRTLAGPKNGVLGAYSLCVRDGFVYFTSGAGVSTSEGYIYKVALAGGPVTIFSDWLAIGAPRGIQPFGNGFVVGNSTDDDLELVGPTGAVASIPFHGSDGAIGIDFPQQIKRRANGEFMVAGFSDPWGVYFYDTSGIQVGAYTTPQVPLSARGCHELENGDILFTAGTLIQRVIVKNATTQLIVNQGGASFRFVERFTPAAACPGDIDGNQSVDAADLSALLAAWGATSGAADLNGSGLVDAADLSILLASWGPC